MKTKRLIRLSIWFIAAIILAACASEDTTEKNEQKLPKPQHVVASFIGRLPGPVRAAKSRTTATHTFHGPAKVSWTAGDRIWVKATDGTWHQSEPAQFLTADRSQANFKLTSGTYSFNPEVRYVGESSNVNQVTVPESQSQTTLGEFSHLGASGDCGTATAKGGGGDYEFTLQHKSAYICFYPRVQDEALHHNVRLERISVRLPYPGMFDYLAGTFDFTNGSYYPNIATLNPTDYITLETHSAPIPSTTRNDTCFYMAISPRYHQLWIAFEFKDPATNITQYKNYEWSEDFKAGEIYDFTANLTPLPSLLPKYYTWDAKLDYWHGYESEQPVINQGQPGATQGQHYPQEDADPRWYHKGSGAVAATELCKNCPNVNELCWYIKRGDPHWDATYRKLIVQSGHLQWVTGGLWLKKKAAILRDNSDITASRFSNAYPDKYGVDRDWRTYTQMADFAYQDLSVFPQYKPANINDYFFLPALGIYYSGNMKELGSAGCYWSSSAAAHDSGNAWYLSISSSWINVVTNSRYLGFSARTFE